MKDELRAAWERYVASWKVASTSQKRELFPMCLAPDCVYTDPLTHATGWDELATYMAAFQEQLPGAYFVTEEFLAHHGRSVARWKMVDAAGISIGEGISYAEYDEQRRLKVMTGFFEPPGSAQRA
jgi:hypothetical protein